MKLWQYSSAHDLGLKAKQRYCSPHRENDLTHSLIRLGWLASVRMVFKVWNHLEIDGLENVPATPPFIVTANHNSHLDALVIASALSLRWRDRISPLAAGDYFFSSKPRAGFSAMILNALPVWRQRQHGQRHELADLRERLREHAAIYIVFPEGSRSRDGQLHPFKPGFATLVAGTNIPVLPCHLSGSFAALPPDKHVVRPSKIILQLGPPLTFESMANHATGWREISAVIHERTLKLQATPHAKPRRAPIRHQLLRTYRFAHLLFYRRRHREPSPTPSQPA
jgi:1-acyl-sn-glycerol-3-phosphate acyltransferase